MSENIVSNEALDLLSETVTDTESGAPPSATPRMQQLLAELDKAASESATIVSSVDKTPTALERSGPKKPKPKSLNPTWSPLTISVFAGILVTGIQILSREAIWSALNLPRLKYWYGYVPRDILEFLARLIGAWPILVTGPFVYPVVAIAASFGLALAAGLGKRKVDAIFRLGGFAWDRNSFCRGWLITGVTGSGKCLGKHTRVLMYDGSIKNVEDIQPGDLLMGPDSRPRTVLSTTKGRGDLFKIIPRKGQPWVCNDVHVLTLKHSAPTNMQRTRKASFRQYAFRSFLEPYRQTILSMKVAGHGPTEISKTVANLSNGTVCPHKTTIVHYVNNRTRFASPKIVKKLDRSTRLRRGVYQAFGLDLSKAQKTVRQKFLWEENDHIVDVPLRDFLERTSEGQRSSWGISQYWKIFRVPVDFAESDEANPFDEDWFYFVGLWLGDGACARSAVTTKDPEVKEFLESFAAKNGWSTHVYTDRRSGVWEISTFRRPLNGPTGYLSDPEHPYKKILRRCLTPENQKFIPLFLKTAARKKRLSLLAGLIDTDGDASRGCLSYISVSQRLAEDVAFLARSLGLAAYVSNVEKSIASLAFTGRYWRVSISGETSIIPCKLSRKASGPRLQKKDVLRTGWRVEPMGEGDYYGFTLDGDGRFLLSDFTVTHNTVSAIVGKFHQVFRNEQGVLRDRWIGSELEAKVEEVEAGYRAYTAPIHSRLNKLREQRAELGVEFEAALQRSLIGDIDFQSLDPQERVRQAEALKAEVETKKNEALEALRNQRLEMVMQLQHLGGDTSEKPEDLERKIASCKADLEELDREIVSVQQSDNLLDQDLTSAAAVEYKRLVSKAKALDEEIGQIEWRELYLIKHQFDATLKKIEQAKYRSFPWGGLCIDEKGLFWQTLLPIARHYNREHHLMLLQTRPDWATAEWKPAARFNLLSDRKIKTSTYAKAIVDTASSVAGGADDKGFFRTQAQTWIEASIDLQWGVRDFQIANGLSEQNAILPSLKRSLDILTSIDAYREWLISENVLQAENSTNKSPAALAVSPAVASAAAQKKLAALVPEDPAFLKALPGRLRKILIDFKRSYWSQPTDQLGGVIGTINNYLTYFSGDDVAEVFCADNTFDIKDMDRGMILLLAMPQKLQTERRYVCTLLKLLFYQHVNDRFDLRTDSDAWVYKNVLILWQDEAQAFVSEADKVVDKIREALGTTVMATQDMLSLFPPLGGKEKAEVVLLNLRNREVFQVASEASALVTADFIGKHEVKRKDRSVSSQGGTTWNYRAEDQHKIKPHTLRELPKYTAIVCHCDGKFKKVLIPPRDAQGNITRWWIDSEAPFFSKVQAKLGLLK
jgi:hypothetical protein